MDGTDPIFASIVVAKRADAVFASALAGLDEMDDFAMSIANAACDRSADARRALAGTAPTTLDGLFELIRFYADVEDDSPGLQHLCSVVAHCPAVTVVRERTPWFASVRNWLKGRALA